MAQRSAPDSTQTGWPSGIPYIVGNEGCERFSYYGMNAILYIYVVSLYLGNAMPDEKAADLATSTVHLFKAGVYALPMVGAILADRLLGKYRTILWLSLVYCLGHLVLSLSEGSFLGLYAGLALIAIGSGGIKPCVSSHVGDQFGRANWHLIPKIFQAFYFTVNFGAFFSTLLIPLFKEWWGWSVAFAIPGVLMFLATMVFWAGRNHFVHVPANPGGKIGLLDALSSIFLFMTVGSLFFTAKQPGWIMGTMSATCLMVGLLIFQRRQTLAKDDGFLAVTFEGMRAFLKSLVERPSLAMASVRAEQPALIGPSLSIADSTRHFLRERFSDEAIAATTAVYRIISVFFLVSLFWALFDQHSSSWVRQAEMMNRVVSLPFWGTIEILPSQIPSINPILVMLLIPVIALTRIRMTPLKRMSFGMAIAALSFVVVALIQMKIDASGVGQIHVGWQLSCYFLITLAEVLVSVTGLEFAYTQAPKRMKATVMGFWLLTISLGNVLVAFLARFAELKLVNFFWVFSGIMGAAALLFALRASFYATRDYPQG